MSQFDTENKDVIASSTGSAAIGAEPTPTPGWRKMAVFGAENKRCCHPPGAARLTDVANCLKLSVEKMILGRPARAGPSREPSRRGPILRAASRSQSPQIPQVGRHS
jgi:hypothetical protein